MQIYTIYSDYKQEGWRLLFRVLIIIGPGGHADGGVLVPY